MNITMQPLIHQPDRAHLTIQEQFEAFHAANPWVYLAMERLALDYLSVGRKRIGIGMLAEVVRWQYGTTIGDTFKLNNNFRSRYVRLLLDSHPEWEGVFETRALRAA